MAQLLATTPGDPEKHAAAEKLARWISQQVTDPKLQITTCRRIARAIVFGTQGAYLPQDELDDALQSLAEKRRRLAAHGTTFDKGPGAYFVASMKRAFARHGVQWTKSHDSAISGGRR